MRRRLLPALLAPAAALAVLAAAGPAQAVAGAPTRPTTGAVPAATAATGTAAASPTAGATAATPTAGATAASGTRGAPAPTAGGQAGPPVRLLPLTPEQAAAERAAVERARAEVTDLDAEVRRTAEELTAGTVRLEEGRARLAGTQTRAFQAREASDRARARAAAARALLARVVNAAYRTPRPDSLTRALASPSGRLAEVVLADAELDRVHVNQADALREATAQGARAQELVLEADRLQADAAAQTAELEGQVAALSASAQATRRRLEAAAARLQAAQSSADQTTRDAAALQALIDISGGAALCRSTSTDGYPNGFLPPDVLCPVAVGSGHRLRADAAAAFNALLAVRPLCVTDSYRSYGAQVDVYARKPNLAAVPGTSNHGLGVALDLCGGVETFGSEAHEWMKANAPRFGWIHPAWAGAGGSRPEPWHWEFVGIPAAEATPR